ncbi:hypothetical protein D3C80_1270350 [compost metagenome]
MLDRLVGRLAALDSTLEPQIGHTSGVTALVGAHFFSAADEFLGAQALVLSQRHNESRQVRCGFVPMDAGCDYPVGTVLVGQPLQRTLEKSFFLFWCRRGEPFRAGGHHVFNSQNRVLAPFLRQQSPQFAYGLVRAFRAQMLIFRCALLVSIVRLAFAVAMLHRGSNASERRQFLAPHDGIAHLI